MKPGDIPIHRFPLEISSIQRSTSTQQDEDRIPVLQSPLVRNVCWENAVDPVILFGYQDGMTRSERASKGMG